MKQTTLQKIIDQKADQIRVAIEEAIDAGAKIEKHWPSFGTIDEVFLQADTANRNNKRFAIILRFDSEKIAKAFAPSKENLEKLAEQKRRELEELETQIKERAKE